MPCKQANDKNLKLKLIQIIHTNFSYDPFVRNASQRFVVPEKNEKLPVIPSLNLVAKGEAVTFIDRLRAIYISKQWLREDGSIPIRLLYKNPVFR